MARKNNGKRPGRAIPPPARVMEHDRKPNIPKSSPPPTFQPFSRVHRSKLNELLSGGSVELTTDGCHAWAALHRVDPSLVVDWVRRRSLGERRQGRPSAVGDGYTHKAGHSVSLSSTASDNIVVKRERAASPDLSEPSSKKRKTCRARMGPTPVQELSIYCNLAPSDTVRHTRAHDSKPHPACRTCTTVGEPSVSDFTRSSPPVVDPDTSDSATSLAPLALGLSSSAVSCAPQPVLKSALRLSRRSSARPPRRVRFSEALYQEALNAYTQHTVSGERLAGAYTQVLPPGPAAVASPTLPPRQKRKRDVYTGEEDVSSLSPLERAGGPLCPTSSGSQSGPGNSDVLSPARSSLAPASRLSSGGVLALFASGSHSLLPSYLSDSPRSLSPFPDQAGMSTDHPGWDKHMSASKRRKLSHSLVRDRSASDTQAASSETDDALPAEHVDASPRTPSPPPSSDSISGSFFSPSFFSPSGNSSSGEDEVEALLVSSPPTSPLLVPRSSSSRAIIAPSPRKLATPPFLNIPARTATPSDEQMPESVPPTLSHDRALSLNVNTVTDNAARGSISPRSLPPPADIPPRSRTPPPGPGSKPGTPQPSRPPRPASEGPGDRIAIVQVPIPPWARTPPGPPGAGSRPSTPIPRRPVRPSAEGGTFGGVGVLVEGDDLDDALWMDVGNADDVRGSGVDPESPSASGDAPPAPSPSGPRVAGAQTSITRPIGDPGADTSEQVPICAPRAIPSGLADSVIVERSAQVIGDENQPTGTHLPMPPRARTPPCPPDRGSRPSTPQPVRPPRPSAGSAGPKESGAAAAKKDAKSRTKRKQEARTKAAQKSRASVQAKKAALAVQVKSEMESEMLWKAGEVLTLDAEEDDASSNCRSKEEGNVWREGGARRRSHQQAQAGEETE
ncbi:hypothetical protein OH77DRAFT_1001967 [Trametes cingulata]|nr:hypothetical protein OH77DRAFT_1001967 [Trametes cingulata]